MSVEATVEEGIWYRVDAGDRVSEVGPAWDDFALRNGGDCVLKEHIIGKSVFHFISDAETRHLHERLLARARSGRVIRNLPFRCDSPEQRRYMEMDLVSLGGGAVEYRCRTVRVEKRPPVHVAAVDLPDGFLRMCSWCNRMDASGAWVELEDAIGRLGLFEEAKIRPVSHGMCNACFEKLYDESN